MTNIPETQRQPIHLIHRLVVILYDFLLLAAVLFFAVAVVSPLLSILGLMDTTQIGQHLLWKHLLLQLYLLAVCYFYFAWPWLRGGQTLGLQAWRAQLVSADTQPVTHKKLFIRFTIALVSWACLGMGFIWSLFEPQRRTWHDLASGTQLIKKPRLQKH